MEQLGDILVVDDETYIVDFVVELLKDEGYAVRSALNGEAALQEITRQVPGLVLLDMFMPRMTGIMLREHLQREGLGNIPIVIMSASSRVAETVQAAGATDYLAKPFDLEQLLACVARYIPRSNAQNKL